jgi:hypothetical protein
LTAKKLFLTAKKLFLTAKKPFLTTGKPVFLPRFVGILKNYRRFRASFKRIWRVFLSALPVLRLIVQTTTIETASGCPQTPHKGGVCSAANAIESR